MGTEIISKLLEKLEKQQYIDVIRSFAQHNKRLKIPGFTSLEKAPLKLVANTARTNKVFCKALLNEISQIFMSDVDINLDNDIQEIKKEIPETKWIGLAAFLLLLDDDAHIAEAVQLIDEYPIQDEYVEVPPKTDKPDGTNEMLDNIMHAIEKGIEDRVQKCSMVEKWRSKVLGVPIA